MAGGPQIFAPMDKYARNNLGGRVTAVVCRGVAIGNLKLSVGTVRKPCLTSEDCKCQYMSEPSCRHCDVNEEHPIR